MNNGFRIGRLAGIDVFIDWSLLIIFMLITFSLAIGVLPSWHPAWNPGLIWVTALASALLFLGSVFVHELSHALVGRAYGMDIRRITLFIFGGMAHLEREPHTWRAELWMAIAGPITSLVLGAVFIFLGGLAAGDVRIDPQEPQRVLAQLGPVSTLLFWLGPVNIILGLFNLVPGFPLDGGRVLRAVLWGATRNLRLATRWASNMGQAFAWVLMITGFAMMFGMQVPIFGTGLIGGLWLAFIGWFLNNAALMSYRQLLIKESLEDVPVARLMKTDVVTLDPDTSVRAFVDEYLLHSDQRAYPVLEDERFAGLVCQQDVRKVERDAWARTTVREIWTPGEQVSAVRPDDDAADAMHALTRRGVNQLPVLDGGRLVGLVRREDILKWLSLRGEPGLNVPDAHRPV